MNVFRNLSTVSVLPRVSAFPRSTLPNYIVKKYFFKLIFIDSYVFLCAVSENNKAKEESHLNIRNEKLIFYLISEHCKYIFKYILLIIS